MGKTRLADFNSEAGYEDGFGFSHMNTVALNEALVHHWAAKGVAVTGFNPGLIASGIRDSLHGGGSLGSILEKLIGFFNPSAEQYASSLLPLLQADTKGLLFGQSGDVIKRAPEFEHAATVAAWIQAADALAAKAAAAAGKLQ
jgi:hypothetical protein